jgi:Protein of unknown function (DUF3710)
MNTGPFDASDVNAPVGLANFGSISFDPNPLVTVRAEIDNQSGKVVALAFDYEDGTLQVQAFASPRNTQILSEVIKDISENLIAQGSKVTEQSGPFGTELLAQINTPEGDAAMRIFGFEGDRWLLKGSITGKGMDKLSVKTFLEDFFRGIVVDRSEVPLPPRELLPLTLPEGAIVPRSNFDR